MKIPEKKRNQLVEPVCDKNAVNSMKLAAKMNVDRSFVGRIVKKAGVTTCEEIRSREYCPDLDQRQKRACRNYFG